ncbi:uncharacterized protein [Linepithema humile]|uniref:uncharacterized protein n=1 Tax=Linepithema humile TaxID=83485 RepID=UPI0006237936|nr:PREDICTED: uncharacterized protein LOC105679942 [Linepithema humile]
MGDDLPGFRVCKAIGDKLIDWVTRGHGWVTFHMAQLITDHGCLNSYLYRINRVDGAMCSHCFWGNDDAQHTLQFCEAWENERNDLKRSIGNDLSLRNIISAILDDNEKWKAFAKFCTVVMSKKEKAERERQLLDRRQRIGYPDNDLSD